MNIDLRVVERLQSLIDFERNIRPLGKAYGGLGSIYSRIPVDPQPARQWATSSLSILGRVFGQDSDHYKQFEGLVSNIDDLVYIKRALGVLQAAKDDYENGYLFNVRVLIEAEVFDNFLEQANALFASGYYGPAAVVAGSVLEDGLRKLCTRHHIALPSRPKLNSMNDDLAKTGVYNSLVQKRITTLADIRNKAAHGQWSEFTAIDVQQMIEQVRIFMEHHFT